jgi:RNA 2',3'-cyclic 3'-phosphodiesterase
MTRRSDRPPTGRLFLAVDLDRAARRAAAAACARLATGLGRAGDDVRWVEADKLHVTLRFLGSLPPGRAAAVRDALAPGWRTAAFDLGLGGAGVFPSSGRPRVVWLGLSTGGNALAALQAEASGRLATAGSEPEARRFSPHLTVGRVRRPAAGLGAALRQAAGQIGPHLARWRVDHVTLYESRLSPAGSHYHPQVEVPLRSREGG